MKKFLDVNQIREFLRLADDERIATGNARDLALFHISFSTGLRISDILMLTRQQVMDPDAQVVRSLRIKMKKTKGWIERPLRNDCREVIFDYLQRRSDQNPYLFPAFGKNQYSQENTPMNRVSAHRIYKKYLRKMFSESEIVRASTHTARRSMAKIISQKSGRIEPASRFLGHKNTASTAAYIDMDGHEATANDIILNDLDLGTETRVPISEKRRRRDKKGAPSHTA